MKARGKILTLIILSSSAVTTTAFINKIIKIKATKNNSLDQQKSHFFHWRLGDIYYERVGTGKPVLLIHDLNAASSSYEWNKLIPLLAENYTVYAIDLLGCGHSEKINTTYTNYLYVQLITDFIKSEIGHRTSIIATGESASIPIMACSNEPSIFEQIMLINPLDLSEYCKIPGKRARLYKKIIDFPVIGTLLYHIAVSRDFIESEAKKHIFYNQYCITPEWIDAYYEAAHLGVSPKSIYASQRCNYTKCNINNALKKINHSISLIGGAEIDNITERLEKYKDLNPAIETAFIPETKYLPQLENAGALNELIKTYF